MGATAHTGEGWGSIATDSGYNRHYNFAFSLLFNTIGNGGPLQRGADSPTGLNCAELGRPFTWNDAMHITCLVYSVLLKSHGHPDGLHCGDSLTSSPEQADNIAEPGSDDRAEVFVTARAKDAGTHRSGCQWQDLAPICAICASKQCQSCLPCVNSSESSLASKPDTEYCTSYVRTNLRMCYCNAGTGQTEAKCTDCFRTHPRVGGAINHCPLGCPGSDLRLPCIPICAQNGCPGFTANLSNANGRQ